MVAEPLIRRERERERERDMWRLGPPGALSHRFFFGWDGRQGTDRQRMGWSLYPPRSPSSANFYRLFFGWEGSPTIDYRRKGTRILASLLEDLGWESAP